MGRPWLHGRCTYPGTMTGMPGAHRLGVFRGAALYVGALIGPGLLLVPALGVQAAGPASIIAWVGLLLLSAPLAATFAALAVRYPVAGGVSAYVRAAFGEATAAVTGGWFLVAIVLGAPAVSLMGGYYVADLTGLGPNVALVVAVCMFGTVLATNAFGLRVSSSLQLVMSSLLVAVLVMAVAGALPQRGGNNWVPFAPHGWWAVGTAANILIWLFVGWEAVAQFAGDFRHPGSDLPRAIALAFGVVTLLYVSLAIATVGVTGHSPSHVPLADLVAVGFGRAGRYVTAVVAVALTMGTMNVYMGGGAKLAAALAEAGAAPLWLGRVGARGVPLRPLALFAATGILILGALAGGFLTITDLIRATSSLFVGVYILSIAAAIRILRGRDRLTALAAVAMVSVVAAFSGWYAVVPAVAAALSIAQWVYFKRLATMRERAPTAASTADSRRRP
jgi:amino acid efflux transporter